MNVWFPCFGVKLYITTDRSPQFESELFTEISKPLGFARLHTTAYHGSDGCRVYVAEPPPAMVGAKGNHIFRREQKRIQVFESGACWPSGRSPTHPTPTPAGTLKQLLIIMLLLMAGIEANRGPRKLPQWPCGVCTQDAPHTCIQCIDCLSWTHFACAQLDPNNLPHTWTCKDCTAQASAPTDSAMRILQFNYNGIRGKLDEITHYMKT